MDSSGFFCHFEQLDVRDRRSFGTKLHSELQTREVTVDHAENDRHAAKPNILVLFGDDIGIINLSCYSHGMMGYHTPKLTRGRELEIISVEVDDERANC